MLIFFLSSCQNEDYSETDNTNKKEENADLLISSFINVDKAISIFKADSANTYVVKGYIVGCVEGTSISKASFNSPFKRESNILLATDKWETDTKKCLPINLPTNSKYREALNLVSNPHIYHQQILIQGKLENYFSQCGIKSIKSYAFISNNSEKNDTTIINDYPVVPF